MPTTTATRLHGQEREISAPPTAAPTSGASAPAAVPAEPPFPRGRIQVRKRGWPLLALRLAQAQTVTLPDGTVKGGAAGDWLITTTNNLAVDLVAGDKLHATYEVLQDTLSVSRTTQRALEDILGLGTCSTEAALLDAVRRVGQITLGGIALDLTHGQLEALAVRAEKRGRTLADEIADVVRSTTEHLLYGAVR